MEALRTIAVAVGSSGWLVFLWLSASTWAEYWTLDPNIEHSFPFVAFAQRCFCVGLTWLGVVLAIWSGAIFHICRHWSPRNVSRRRDAQNVLGSE
jgi:hypothetical protein